MGHIHTHLTLKRCNFIYKQVIRLKFSVLLVSTMMESLATNFQSCGSNTS